MQSKPITPVVKKAFNYEIPVLLTDRKTEVNNYTSYLGGDNIEVGRNTAKVNRLQCQRLCKRLGNQRNGKILACR